MRLIYAALSTCLIVICGYITGQILLDWQDQVTQKLDKLLDNRGGEFLVLLNDSSQLKPMEKGNEYWLFYPAHGNLQNKDGICPKRSDLNWLNSFRSAITSCTDSTGQVKLRVQAFASTAPVTKETEIDTPASHLLNCEIANQRGEAVIHFLTTKSDDPNGCKEALENGERWGRKNNELCKRARLDTSVWSTMDTDVKVTYEPWPTHRRGSTDSVYVWHGPGFQMTYVPWQRHESMKKSRLVKDGTLDNRRKELEFLNRTVQIIIEDGGCLTKMVDNHTTSDQVQD